MVPKNYETAYFLNDEDKAVMRQRAEVMEAYSGGSGHYTLEDIKEAARDVKSWIHGVIQIAVVTILYGKPEFSCNAEYMSSPVFQDSVLSYQS